MPSVNPASAKLWQRWCALMLAAVLALGIGNTVSAASQYFDRVDDKLGLSQGTIRAVSQDFQGFIWIGTEDGLGRYDGYSVFEYRANESGLTDNLIRALAVDRDGTLWVGAGRGLNVYLPETDSFAPVRFRIGNQQVDDIQINSLATNGRTLWIGTKQGLVRHELGTDVFASIAMEGLPASYNVRALHVSGDKLWVGVYGTGLWQLDVQSNQSRAFEYPVDFSDDTRKIIELTGDDKGRLWLATFGGLLSLNPDSGEFERHQNLLVEAADESRDDIKSVYFDGEHTLWVGSLYHGLFEWDLRSRQISQHVADPTLPGSLSSNSVETVFKDRRGVLWVGTDGGFLNKASPRPIVFGHVSHNPANPDSIAGDIVYSILETQAGELWIGTEQNGLSIRASGGDGFRQVDNDAIGASEKIYMLYQLSNEDVLIGTDQGLARVDHSSGRYYFIPPGYQATSIYSAFEDAEGRVWIGTSRGLAELKNDLLEYHDAGLTEMREKRIRVVQGYSDGLLIGTERGLFSFSPETYQFSRFDFGDIANEDDITSILRIGNHVWLGTYGNGLVKYMFGSPNAYRMSKADGLPNETIYAIQTAGDKSLWISTGDGLVRLAPETKSPGAFKVQQFVDIDGQPIQEFNANSSFLTDSGRLYFGGTSGFVSFEPSSLSIDERPPDIAFTEFRVLNQTVADFAEEGDKHLTLPIQFSDEVTLHHGDTTFSIEFTALDFASPAKNLFQHKLVGFDADWIVDQAEDRRVTYTNLDPGTYVLKVRASNKDGIWNLEGKSIKVNILPSPWLSWWAYLIYFAVGMTVFSVMGYLAWSRYSERHRAADKILQSEKRLKLSLWGSGDEMWDWDLVSGTLHLSNKWNIDFPRDGQRSDYSISESNIHPNDLPHVKAALNAHISGKTPHYESTYRINDGQNHWVWVLDRGVIAERDDAGLPLRMAGTLKNITELKNAEEKLRIIVKSFDNISDGVWILDTDFNYVAINKAFTRITGFSERDVIGRPARLNILPDNPDQLSDRVKLSLQSEGQWQGEIKSRRKNGEVYPVELSVDLVRDSDGDITHYVGVFSDITFRKKAEEELRRLASFDHLTSLPNRTLFKERLEHAIAGSSRTLKRHALLFIDLDNFKRVNDSLGHSIGDELLARVAELLKKAVREDDTVARLGGDEFTVLLEGIHDWRTPARVAQKILDSLSSPIKLSQNEVVVSPSIGIVMYPEDGVRAEELMKNSDTAMYYAKSKGKNNYQFFTKQMNEQAQLRLEMENELRRAIDDDDFVVYYQPKISLTTGRITGLEALVRWDNRKRGLLQPDQFIYLAEESGYIVQIGEIVLRKACEQIKEWVETEKFVGRVAVNLSAIQFYNEELVDTIDRVIAETGVSPEFLELEITEGMVMHNMALAIEQMRQLRQRGIGLAVDDFGVGYSSLSNLKDFPLSSLKIDRTFIWDIVDSEKDRNMVEAIINLSHNLGLKVVAEGVETRAQVGLLHELNCEEIQGFVYSEPLPPVDVEKIFIEDKNYLKNIGLALTG